MCKHYQDKFILPLEEQVTIWQWIPMFFQDCIIYQTKEWIKENSPIWTSWNCWNQNG